MSLFSCCVSARKQQQEKSDREARHARIIDIYTQAQRQAQTNTQTQTHTQAAPPSYEEVIYDGMSGITLIVDDKPATDELRAPIPRPTSPQTSIYSVPSTRLTDITSAHTGGTVVEEAERIDSPRSSLVFDSAPPSYWDGRSMRERSRSRSPVPIWRAEDAEGQQDLQRESHPVMAEQWFERLCSLANQARSS